MYFFKPCIIYVPVSPPKAANVGIFGEEGLELLD